MILGLPVGVLLFVSAFFCTFAVAALFRMPDVYLRIHGVTRCGLAGVLFALVALLLHSFVCFIWGEGEIQAPSFFLRFLIAGSLLLCLKPAVAYALAQLAFRADRSCEAGRGVLK
ncbi:MAG: hypothetical protein GX256_10305 [Fretibacterium sp.]|nr:hypothetical protein [Fretibacterium sp.]